MKLTKEDWFKLASPVVLIVVGVLLACSVIEGVGKVFDTIIGVVLLIIGAIYLSIAFVRRKNVLDRYGIWGLAFMGLGTAEIVPGGLFETIKKIVGQGIGWTLFFFGCLGTILSIIYLCMNKNIKFYAIELSVAVVCGVIGGLIVFPIGQGIIPDNYLWLVIGIIFAIVGIIWLVFTIIWFNNKEARARKAARR